MQELTSKEFQDTIAKGNAVIDFWAPWCGPCRMMAPVFEETGKEHKGTVFAKVNVDENNDIAGAMAVRGIPTIIFFKDGQEIGRHVGYADKRTLDAKINAAFKQ